MTDLRKAAEMALEALEKLTDKRIFTADLAGYYGAVISSLRQALAQPEQAEIKQGWDVDTLLDKQEPVAWIEGLEKPQPRCVTNLNYRSVAEAKAGVQFIPLYTSPQKREWQELTDEDWHNLPTSNKQGCERDAEIFNWIEDKLKEKNT